MLLAPLISRLYFFVIPIAFFSFCILLILNFKKIKAHFTGIDNKVWVFLIIIFLVGGYLRFFVAPHTFNHFNDGYYHVSRAQNFWRKGQVGRCSFGTGSDCYKTHLGLLPGGYPFLLSFVLLIFENITSVFYFSSLIGSLSIIFAFFTSYLIFSDERVALLSALLLALLPPHIKFSGSALPGVTSAFFILLTYLFFFYFLKEKDYKSFLLLIFSACFTLQIRLENIFIILPLSIFFLLHENVIQIKEGLEVFEFKISKLISWMKERQCRKYFFGVFLFLILIAPLISHIYLNYNNFYGENTGIASLESNIIPNSLSFLNPRIYLPPITVLAIVSIFLKKDRPRRMLLFLSAVLFLLFYSSHGPIKMAGIQTRFLILPSLFLILLAGKGLIKLSEKLNKKWIVIVFIALIFIQFSLTLKYIERHPSPFFHQEYKFLRGVENKIPDNCWTVSYNSETILATTGEKSITFRLLTSDKRPLNESILSTFNSSLKEGCFLFYRGYWSEKEGLWDELSRKYKLEPLLVKKKNETYRPRLSLWDYLFEVNFPRYENETKEFGFYKIQENK